MKCWNSAFNAQGSRGFYSSCTRSSRSSENICNSSGGAQGKGKKTRWNSVDHQMCWKNYSLGPSYFALWISIPSYTFDALGGAQGKGKTGWNSIYHQMCWKSYSLGPSYFALWICIPSYTFDALGGAQGKGKKTGWNSVYHQMCWKNYSLGPSYFAL